MKVKYLVLQYCPDVLSASGQDIALVFCRLESGSSGGLHLLRLPAWESRINAQDLVYVSAVFDDVQTLSGEDSEETFEQFQGMSSGCLRAERQGTCDEFEVATLAPSA